MIVAARISDDPIAGAGEYRLLIQPDQRAARRWMQEYDRLSGAARVPIAKMSAGKLCHSVLCRSLFRYRHGNHRVVQLSGQNALVHHIRSTYALTLAGIRGSKFWIFSGLHSQLCRTVIPTGLMIKEVLI